MFYLWGCSNMLKITLYQDCILNENYQQVFSLGTQTGQTKNVLERYLDTLISKTLEIDYVYQENFGTLIFDIQLLVVSLTPPYLGYDSIYKFNYMKIQTIDTEDTYQILRYCFIDKILLKNDLVYLDYSEDIWSSYSHNIKGITTSYLERSRVLNYGNTLNDLKINLYNLPVEYNGNNNILYEELSSNTFQNGTFRLILELQQYNLDSEGNPTKRFSSYYITQDYGNYSSIRQLLERIIYLSQEKSFRYFPSGATEVEELYFQVGKILILPTDFLSTSHLIGVSNWIQDGSSRIDFYSIKFSSEILMYTTGLILKNGTIINSFKNKMFGTYSQKFDIINNGTNINYKLKLYRDNYNISLILDFQNQLIDITDSFEIQIPFNYLQGSELAQQQMNRKLTTINGITKIGTGIIETGLDIASAGINGGIGIAKTAGKSVSKINKRETKTGYSKTKTSEYIPGQASIFDLSSKELSGIPSIIKGITNLIEINSPIYSTSFGTFVDSNGILNTMLGSLFIFKIDSDNDNYVKNSINTTGYITYEYLHDITKLKINNVDYFLNLTTPIYYNTIKFSTINIYGSFPRNIALQLNEILENGTRIWYDYQMRNDNLVVG